MDPAAEPEKAPKTPEQKLSGIGATEDQMNARATVPQRGAESSRGEQRDQQHQQEITNHEQRDPAVSRARLGPQQFVTEPDQVSDELEVHSGRITSALR